MKLRSALAAAATTAVMTPLALLAAPAAYATTDSAATTTTTTTEPAPSATTDTSPSTGATTPDGTASTGTGTETSSGAPTTGAPTTGTPSGTPSTESPTTKPTGTPSGTPPTSPTGTPSGEPTDEPELPDLPYCEEVGEDYTQDAVTADITGLPGKIVAGSGWHTFSLTVTNDSKTDVKDVGFYAEVENYELDEDKWLSPYVTLQFKSSQTGAWERIGDASYAGGYFGGTDVLKAGETATVPLRVSITKNAPAGDAYSLGTGAYLDNVEGQDCIAEGLAAYDFEVLAAGSPNPSPSDATLKPSNTPAPQGSSSPTASASATATATATATASPTATTSAGTLAATGSDSSLPVIGLAGGVAVLAGAGVVFALRRREGADA